MTDTFNPGDRVTQKNPYDWTDDPGRPGTIVAGPGAQVPTGASGFGYIVVGPEFALVHFDNDPEGQAWMVSTLNLRREQS